MMGSGIPCGLLTLVAIVVSQTNGAAAQAGGVSRVDSVSAPSLRGNLLGDASVREATIYLPPSYSRNTMRRYPVVYLLHGFAANHRAFMAGAYQNLNVRLSMDSLIRAGAVREMIVVTPNARNVFDGSFYGNSVTTGNWEDFIARDLVAHMDRNYRTVRSRKGRGIAGHSMGGFGALRVGMRNPQAFSALYALSPCCLGELPESDREQRVLRPALQISSRADYAKASFAAKILFALSALYWPNPGKPPFFLDLPYRMKGDSAVREPFAASPQSFVPLAMVSRHAPGLRRLRIAFDAGTRDGFPDIPVNVQRLDSLFTNLNIPHVAELYDGTHGSRIRERLETKVFPFFSEALR